LCSNNRLAVTPKNYLLFGCHVVNEGAQLTQGYRYLQYWKYVSHHARYPRNIMLISMSDSWGGREKSLTEQAKTGIASVEGKAHEVIEKGKEIVDKK
jgi:hypothetical protein